MCRADFGRHEIGGDYLNALSLSVLLKTFRAHQGKSDKSAYKISGCDPKDKANSNNFI